jgi:hypothetical protein
MNPTRTIRRLACILAGLAAGLLALATVSQPAFARPWPPPAGPTVLVTPPPLPPGWNKHPPLPTHAHSLATGGLPGWQITLITAAAVLLVTALAAAAYRLRAARRCAAASPA